eukprot:6195598-Pleurochrysis_carterae.AAC.1
MAAAPALPVPVAVAFLLLKRGWRVELIARARPSLAQLFARFLLQGLKPLLADLGVHVEFSEVAEKLKTRVELHFFLHGAQKYDNLVGNFVAAHSKHLHANPVRIEQVVDDFGSRRRFSSRHLPVPFVHQLQRAVYCWLDAVRRQVTGRELLVWRKRLGDQPFRQRLAIVALVQHVERVVKCEDVPCIHTFVGFLRHDALKRPLKVVVVSDQLLLRLQVDLVERQVPRTAGQVLPAVKQRGDFGCLQVRPAVHFTQPLDVVLADAAHVRIGRHCRAPSNDVQRIGSSSSSGRWSWGVWNAAVIREEAVRRR